MPTLATGNSPSDAGYTLIELLVVLVVIGLVSGLAATMFPGRTSALELATAARHIAAFAEKAHADAQASNRPVVMVLDAQQHRLISSGDDQSLLLPPEAKVTIAPMLPVDRPASILFYPDGSSSGGAITLQSGAGQTSIDIEWLSGQTTVRATRDAR